MKLSTSKKSPDISYENLVRAKIVYYSLMGFAVFFLCLTFIFALGTKSDDSTICLISSVMFFVSLSISTVISIMAVSAESKYEYLKAKICSRCGKTIDDE